MTEQERLEILETIRNMKDAYDLHSKLDIIKNEEERQKHLFAIIDAIQELEELLKNDLDKFN